MEGGSVPLTILVCELSSYVIDPKDSIFQSKLEFDPSLDQKLCWLVLVAQKAIRKTIKNHDD